MRCKEHFQGDRCKKEANHALSVNPEVDEMHRGNFTVWQGTGDSKQALVSTKPARKRNRLANRFLRQLPTLYMFSSSNRKLFITQCEQLVKHYRG